MADPSQRRCPAIPGLIRGSHKGDADLSQRAEIGLQGLSWQDLENAGAGPRRDRVARVQFASSHQESACQLEHRIERVPQDITAIPLTHNLPVQPR